MWQTQLSVSNSLLQYYKDADVLGLFCGNSWIGTVLLRVASQFVEGGVKERLLLSVERGIFLQPNLFFHVS